MRREDQRGGALRLGDVILLLCVVGLALATWMCFSHAARPDRWKSHISMLTVMVLALAATTPRPYWAAWLRLLTGAWIIAAPYLLTFSDNAPATRAYLILGLAIVAMALPGIWRHLAGGGRVPFPVLYPKVHTAGTGSSTRA